MEPPMARRGVRSSAAASAAGLLALLAVAPTAAAAQPMCTYPVNQLACRLSNDGNSYVIAVWLGPWGPNPDAYAAGRQDYIKGEPVPGGSSTYWYTNNYCAPQPFTTVCGLGFPAGADIDAVTPPFPNNTLLANSTQRLSFVSAMRVYSKGMSVLRVEFDTQLWDVGRFPVPGLAPLPFYTAVAGGNSTVACGRNATGLPAKGVRVKRLQPRNPQLVFGTPGGMCGVGPGGAGIRGGAGACYTYPAPYSGAKFVVPNRVNANSNTSQFYKQFYCPGGANPGGR